MTDGTIEILTTSSYVAVNTEGDAATDDLSTIIVGSDGDIVVLTTYSTDRVVTVKVGTDIRMKGDFQMSSSDDTLMLMKHVTGFWVEICRSDNSV